MTYCAIIKVTPWLSYGCGEGARIAVRSPGAIEGRCATCIRSLRDDQVVMRFDSVSGESSVDPTPLSVVRTAAPRHQVSIMEVPAQALRVRGPRGPRGPRVRARVSLALLRIA